jgi:hypothetical protein
MHAPAMPTLISIRSTSPMCVRPYRCTVAGGFGVLTMVDQAAALALISPQWLATRNTQIPMTVALLRPNRRYWCEDRARDAAPLPLKAVQHCNAPAATGQASCLMQIMDKVWHTAGAAPVCLQMWGLLEDRGEARSGGQKHELALWGRIPMVKHAAPGN